jgi:uncharacterized protein (DUF1684 family)
MLMLAVLSAPCVFAGNPSASPSTTVPDAAYKASLEKWKASLAESRKKNWLPLAGLFWLKPGDNSFGNDPKNDIVFPKGPAHAGTFHLEGKDVSVKFAPGTTAAVDGKPITEAKLVPDSADNTTVVEMGSLRFHVIVRGEHIGIRLKDLESDAVHKYSGAQFFPTNLNYRVTAKWIPGDGKKIMQVPDVLGDVTPVTAAGTAVFSMGGQELHLTSMEGNPADELFFVFSDLTSKSRTYPGGRFLYAGPVVNGTIVLDFNRAYSPPCAVTPYATCPLAPKENRLPVAVLAGEKYDRANHH